MNRLVQSAPVGWYGKIPSAGDFVKQQLPYPVLTSWERWMQNGLGALQQSAPDALVRHYAVAPLWNFLLPAGLGQDVVQLGVLAPSCDRVGRYYPVCASLQLPLEQFTNAMLARADGLYRPLGQAILDAVRQAHSIDHLSAALEQAGSRWLADSPFGPRVQSARAAWPELATFFDPLGATSFWWTNQGDGSPLQTTMHTGALNNSLFARLFGPQQGCL